MRKIIFLFLILMYLCTSSVFAESEDYVEKTYDFHTIKSIFILPIQFGSDIDDISRHNITDITVDKLNINHVKLLYTPDIINIMAKNGYNTSNQNSPEFMNAFVDTVKNNADIVIQIHVNAYGMGETYEEGKTIAYQNSTAIITSKSAVVVPQTYYQHTAGGYASVASTSITIHVYDTKNNMLVLGQKDNRNRKNSRSGLFKRSTTPSDLYRRILGTFNDTLSSLIINK